MGDNQKTFELGRMDIVDIYEWLEGNKIITGPVFQRLSVWKDKDREDLIDTIMNGYPIPAIFICEGSTNFSQIGKKYVVLDGKQRLESISKFLKNEVKYKGKTFGEFDNSEKSKFLNFSLPVVQMYIDVSTELEKVQEIFKRLNKNSYNLNEIEKSLSQYIDYDFVNISKILCSYLEIEEEASEIEEEASEIEEDTDTKEYIIKSDYNELYFLKSYIIDFFKTTDVSYIKSIFTDKRFFTPHEQSRQKSIQHLINILGALIKNEHIQRNIPGSEYEKFSDENFIKKDLFNIIINLNSSYQKLIELFNKLENDTSLSSLKKFWFTKSNLYTLSLILYKYKNIDIDNFKTRLLTFDKDFQDEFKNYSFASKEGVNNKNNRVTRENILVKVFNL
jgi:uncharacterized protein with ParB-like and HNH nuclease domain